jgi:hypothetical protein
VSSAAAGSPPRKRAPRRRRGRRTPGRGMSPYVSSAPRRSARSLSRNEIAGPGGSEARSSPRAGRTSRSAEDATYLCSAAGVHQLTRRPCGARIGRRRSRGRAGHDDPDRGIAIARPVPRPTRKQSRGSSHDATTGAIEMSPLRSRASRPVSDESSRGLRGPMVAALRLKQPCQRGYRSVPRGAV